MWLLVWALAGCDGGIDYVEDTEPEVIPDTEDNSCDELEIKWDGPDSPQVGDEWTVLLYCDDALVMGGLIIRVEPVEMATLAENVITWTQAGEATVTVQRGPDIAEEAVTIAP